MEFPGLKINCDIDRETLDETQKFLRSHLIESNRRMQHNVDNCSYILMAGTPIFKGGNVRWRRCSGP